MCPILICCVSTYCVLKKNGLLCGRQLCEHLLCAPALGCCVSTYCVSGIGLPWEQRMRAKL